MAGSILESGCTDPTGNRQLGNVPRKGQAAWDQPWEGLQAWTRATAHPPAPGSSTGGGKHREARGSNGDRATYAAPVLVNHSGMTCQGKSLQWGVNMRESGFLLNEGGKAGGGAEASCLCHTAEKCLARILKPSDRRQTTPPSSGHGMGVKGE